SILCKNGPHVDVFVVAYIEQNDQPVSTVMNLVLMEVCESQSDKERCKCGVDCVIRSEVVVVPRPRWSERVRDRAQRGREQEEETDERDQERRDPHPDRDPAILVHDRQDQAETLLPGYHREIPWTAGGAGCVSRE